MIVYVEKKVLEDPAIVGDDSFGPVKKKFCTFREGERRGGARRSAPTPALAADGASRLPPRLRRHLQPDRLHHLPGRGRDAALRLLALPGESASRCRLRRVLGLMDAVQTAALVS